MLSNATGATASACPTSGLGRCLQRGGVNRLRTARPGPPIHRVVPKHDALRAAHGSRVRRDRPRLVAGASEYPSVHSVLISTARRSLASTSTPVAPGQAAVINDTDSRLSVCFAPRTAAGRLLRQAIAAVYTQVHGFDGHTLWIHLDQWEGQHISNGPGNLVSQIRRVHLESRPRV